jgi:hypothetical protein
VVGNTHASESMLRRAGIDDGPGYAGLKGAI